MKKVFQTLSDRLQYALHITQTQKADLARTLDVSPQTIQHLCYGNVRASRFTFELSAALGLNSKWLATGEGEPFFSDDPNNKILSEYQAVPILNDAALIAFAKTDKLPQTEEIYPYKKSDKNIFCVYMPDASMQPLFPVRSKIFFKKTKKIPIGNKIVIAYLPDYESILIREYKKENNRDYLCPRNTTLFNNIQIPKNAFIFGIAVECQFSID